MHKYGSIVGGVKQVMTRKDKREMKKWFKAREDGAKGVRLAVESFNHIARNDSYNQTWARPERYAHFRYVSNKMQ